MLRNPWRRFQGLLPSKAIIVGSIIAHNTDGTSTIQTVDGATLRAKGQTVAIGQYAIIREGRVEAQAAVLPSFSVDV